jgi:S-formylglutathione hydrolase FrmB
MGGRGSQIVVCLAFAALAAPSASARGEAAGLAVADEQKLSPRLTDYTMGTPALVGDVHVRVLIPAGFDASAARRYPVLYLLNGCCEDWRSWTDLGHAEDSTAAYPVIVVMPEGGYDGNYTDWFNDGAFGPPRWETFHVNQLIPWVERTFPAVRGRRGRAVAGLSMGGFGALSYAARHPGLFTAAASFSGVIDTNTAAGSQAVDYESLQGGHAPFGPFGPRETQEVRWRAHNPFDLAENLRGLPLTLRTGNGKPGGDYGSGSPDAIEDLVHRENLSTHDRLLELGIRHVWDDYGPGQHEWPYWEQDLRRTLPWLMKRFARPRRTPRVVTHTAAEPAYRAWGWNVAVRRVALEFSTLRDASRRGFTLSGSGDARVTTPRLYRRGCRYRLTTTGRGGRSTAIRRAGRRGRLRIPVLLGPDNPDQQYTRGAVTHVYETRVTVRPRPCRHARRGR